jgi:hypothetical protein
MRKYEYFYDSDKVLTHIDDAFKPNIYTSIEGVEFIVRDGDKNIKHYAVKDRLKSLGFGFTGGGESPEHYNAKMKIVKELKYYDDVFNQEIQFAKVVPEKGMNGKIPDLSCYDDQDNLVMLIEIKCTNEKSIEDIEKLSVNKVPLIEIDIKNDNKCKHLVLPTLLETNKPRFKEVRRLFKESSKGFKEKIEKSEREYRENAEKYSPDINFFRDGIQEAKQGIQSEFREQISGINASIESSIERIRDGIRECGEREKELRNDIESFKGKISNNDESTYKIDYRIGKVEAEIDRVELEIIQRKNNTKKIAGSCKIEWFRSDWMQDPVKNKLEEIRYWCS